MLFPSTQAAEVEEYLGRISRPRSLALRRPDDRLFARIDSRHVAVVDAAELFIEAYADEPLTIEVIARAANAKPATLFAAFRRHRDTTPMAHVRAIRLERARADLASCDRVSVTAVAHKHGFSHLGRFSVAYRHRFGETPSTTLVRAKKEAPS